MKLEKHAGRIDDGDAGGDAALVSSANTRLARCGGVNAVESWNHAHGKLSMRHGNAPHATFRRTTSLSTTNQRGCPLSGGYTKAVFDRGCVRTGPCLG